MMPECISMIVSTSMIVGGGSSHCRGYARAEAVADTDAPTISIQNNENGTITVTFEGKLQSASAVNGPWHDVNAVSPLIINTDEIIQFVRAVR